MRRDRYDFAPNLEFLRFVAVATAHLMESVPTAERQATSVSSSQFHPPRPLPLCPSRLSRAACLQERLFTVPSGNHWPKAPLQDRLRLEERRCHLLLAARSHTRYRRGSRDSHPRGILAIRREQLIIRRPQRTPTAGDDPTRKTTTRVCHLRMCTGNTTPADARLRLPARAAPPRSHSTTTLRMRASSLAIGPAPHAVTARTPRSREGTAR